MRTIALVAYAVSDKYGSEYAVGWEFITHMAKSGKYKFVVYYGSCKGNSMGNIESLPFVKNVIWKCIELPDNLRYQLYWFIRRNIYYVYGFYFQFRAWHKIVADQISKDHEIEKFDVIHYLNPIGIKEPGYSWKLDIPYVWGPIQGVENWPRCLYNILGFKGKIEAYTRRFIQNFHLRYSLRLKKAIERANIIIGATPNTCNQLATQFHKQSLYLSENGLNNSSNAILKKYQKDNVLQLIWVGELSSRKGLILLLMALQGLGEFKNKIHLSIYGDGKQRDNLQNYVTRNNLSSSVTFWGKVNRNEVNNAFKKSHLHIITSLSEATTTVIWEAKASGVPTMTLNHCGMAGVVNSDNGIKIQIVSLKQVINDIKLNIINIIKHPLIIEKLSKGVLDTNSLYSWKERCFMFDSVYEEAITDYMLRNHDKYSKK